MSSDPQGTGGRRARKGDRLVLRCTARQKRAVRVVARAKGYKERAGAVMLRDHSLNDIVAEYERLVARGIAS